MRNELFTIMLEGKSQKELKEEYKRLIGEIQRLYKNDRGLPLTIEEIAAKMGMTRPHVQNLMSYNPNVKKPVNIGQKHFDLIKLHFPSVYGNLTHEEVSKSDERLPDWQQIALLLKENQQLKNEKEQLRKKISALEKQIGGEKELNNRLTAIEQGLSEIKKVQQITFAIDRAYYNHLLQQAKQSRTEEDVQKKIAAEAASFLKKYQKEGIHL